MLFDFSPPKIQPVKLLRNPKDVSLFMLREDEIHPFISGNKIRKLKYNIKHIKENSFSFVITFGGAFSNHLAATAYAAKRYGIPCIGIVRGEELKTKTLNPTLLFCKKHGMQLEFVSRSLYAHYTKNSDGLDPKASPYSILDSQYPNAYILPEGGTNKRAILGTAEILGDHTKHFSHIAVSIGTGGTFLGILSSLQEQQEVLGFSAVRSEPRLPLALQRQIRTTNFQYITSYNLGGYAKISLEYINFVNQFQHENKIPLDAVYTGKLMWGLLQKIEQGDFPKNASILAVHTGGLQGNVGMNERLKKLKLPEINKL